MRVFSTVSLYIMIEVRNFFVELYKGPGEVDQAQQRRRPPASDVGASEVLQ